MNLFPLKKFVSLIKNPPKGLLTGCALLPIFVPGLIFPNL